MGAALVGRVTVDQILHVALDIQYSIQLHVPTSPMPIRITHCYNGLTDYGSVAANQATYLGTISTDGAGPGLVAFRFGAISIPSAFEVWNAYNRVVVATTSAVTGTWTYASTTAREVAGSINTRCFFVSGIAEDGIIVSYFVRTVFPGVGNMNAYISNLNSVTAPGAATSITVANAVGDQHTLPVNTNFVGQIGFHFVTALENGDGSDTYTGIGDTNMGLTVDLRM